jgi:bifunctional DNase/RNase
MDLMRIIINENSDQHIIFLKEVEGDRMFPIVIGIFEASSIDRRVKNQQSQRPLTHDLLANAIELLGGELQDIYISELRDHTYFAKLRIRHEGEVLEVDSRPSDAIALAIRAKVPIYVEDGVLDQAGMVFESEEAEGEATATKEDATPVDEEKLTIFKQFIETLDIDDLGKGGGSTGGSTEPKEPKR